MAAPYSSLPQHKFVCCFVKQTELPTTWTQLVSKYPAENTDRKQEKKAYLGFPEWLVVVGEVGNACPVFWDGMTQNNTVELLEGNTITYPLNSLLKLCSRSHWWNLKSTHSGPTLYCPELHQNKHRSDWQVSKELPYIKMCSISTTISGQLNSTAYCGSGQPITLRFRWFSFFLRQSPTGIFMC